MPNWYNLIASLPVDPGYKQLIINAVQADKNQLSAANTQNTARMQKIIDTLNMQVTAYRRVLEDLTMHNAGMRNY